MRRAELQARLQDAIQLAQAGQRTEARRLLDDIVRVDATIALAWLWLATVSTDRDERIHFLERTLALDPTNTRAQEAYAQLTGHVFEAPAAPLPVEQAEGRVARLSPSAVNLFVLAGVVVVGLVVVLLLTGVFNSENTATPLPTMPSRTPSHTPGPTPTATWTPLPSQTPGPSPTSIWQTAPPTWTPSATNTTAPTRRPPVTSTPQPTYTPTRTVTPDATRTAQAATQTAAFALTSDGAGRSSDAGEGAE